MYGYKSLLCHDNVVFLCTNASWVLHYCAVLVCTYTPVKYLTTWGCKKHSICILSDHEHKIERTALSHYGCLYGPMNTIGEILDTSFAQEILAEFKPLQWNSNHHVQVAYLHSTRINFMIHKHYIIQLKRTCKSVVRWTLTQWRNHTHETGASTHHISNDNFIQNTLSPVYHNEVCSSLWAWCIYQFVK